MKKKSVIRLIPVMFVLLLLVTVFATAMGAEKVFVDDPSAPYEVTWYMVGDTQTDVVAVNAAANQYLATKLPNTTLKMFHYDWGTWFGRIPAMIKNKEAFDIFFTPEWLRYYDWYKQGALLPLDDLLHKYAHGTEKALAKEHLQGVAINGECYGVPVKKDIGVAYGFLFNKTYLDKYGFNPDEITRFEDIEPWLATIWQNEPGVVPFDPGNYGFRPFTQFVCPAGDNVPGALTEDDMTKGKFFNQIEQPRFLELAGVNYRWAQAGYISPQAADQAVMNQLRQSGSVFCRAEMLKPLKDIQESNVNVTWVMKYITKPVITTAMTSGSMHAISATSENPVRAMKLLELANTDKAFADLLTYGVENRHYTRIDTNTVQRIPNSGYAPYVWGMCSQYILSMQARDIPNRWELLAEFDKTARPVPALGFRYDKMRLAAENGAMISIRYRYDSALKYGTVDPAVAIPQWIQEIRDAGGDRVLSDVQAQYDAWKKLK